MLCLIKYALDLPLYVLRQLLLNKFGNLLSIESMAITNGKEMSSSILSEMWQRQKRILINFIWVGRLESSLGSKCKFRDTIIKFSCCICLLRLISDNFFRNWRSQCLIARLIYCFSSFYSTSVIVFTVNNCFLCGLRRRANYLLLIYLCSILRDSFNIRISTTCLVNHGHPVDFVRSKRPLMSLLFSTLRRLIILLHYHISLKDRLWLMIRVWCCIKVLYDLIQRRDWVPITNYLRVVPAFLH